MLKAVLVLGQQLRCSNSDELKSVSLPLGDKNNNYSLTIVVTVKNGDKDTNVTITTQVGHLSQYMPLEELVFVWRLNVFVWRLNSHTDIFKTGLVLCYFARYGRVVPALRWTLCRLLLRVL